MTKELFKDIVYTGSGGRFLVFVIQPYESFTSYYMIVPRFLAHDTVEKYLKNTDEHMTFKNTGDRIISVRFINNIQELSWIM